VTALKKCAVIFLHSKRESEKISKAHPGRQVVMLAAVDPSRFKRSAIKGKKIVWIGTPSERKDPDLFLSIVSALPNEKFLLIGKEWMKSRYALRIGELHNLEYREIEGPLTVEDLDGCDLHIVTSKVEGGPMPLMECLAAGLMSISTDSGFVREIYGIAGIPETLIISPDIDSFTQAIVTARTMASSGFTPARDEILSLDFPKLIGLLDTNLA
jgi:glycosyltransferase involved in cell wall biosynthesis